MTSAKEIHDLELKIIAKLKKAKENHNYFCTNFLKIATKSGGIDPFLLNSIQMNLLQFLNSNQTSSNRKKHIVILKARQFGISTFIASYYFHKILFHKNKKSALVSKDTDSSSSIFNMTKLFYQQLPEYTKLVFPKENNNAKIISIADTNSFMRIYTAGGEEIGRSTTNNYVHLSEVAFYKDFNLIKTGLLQTVPDGDDNIIIHESTANGNNHFRELYEEGLDDKSDKASLFYGWNIFHEYRRAIEIPEDFILTEEERNLQRAFKLTNEQINWRRNKIKNDFSGRDFLFKQEYPIMWQEAFMGQVNEHPLIPTELIYKASENTTITPNSMEPIVAGVDPARNGDRTVITIRQGRCILRIFVLKNKTAPEIEAFLIREVINKYNPDKIFIDAGYGLDIADHLKENGYKNIEAIYFNQRPYERDLFSNIRSEMHEKLREWFKQEGGCQIPKHGDLINELSIIPDMKVNSLGKFYMIDKDEIKLLNKGKSPDFVDSMCLTFAKPVIKKTSDYRDITFNRIKK
jgi:hypothetical protein